MSEAYKKFDLSGKAAFVTGGATGIGYFMSRGLARSGARVMIAARREQVLAEAVRRLTDESDGNVVLFRTIDLSSKNSVRETAEFAIAELGGVDILIGNAALTGYQTIANIQDETLDEVIDTNVKSNVILARAFLPHMRKNRWGRIIFSSSMSSVTASAQEGMGAYATSKGALNAFTRVLAAETGHEGITVNNLVLGPFKSEMQQAAFDQIERDYGRDYLRELAHSYSDMTSVGRFGDPEEVEGVVQLLASNAGSFITGSSMAVDGGLTIMMRANPTIES